MTSKLTMPAEIEVSRHRIRNEAPARQTMDPQSLMQNLADILRLPDECLGMSFVCLNKYRRFHKNQDNAPKLDDHMLTLACLSAASKATEAPRRVREFLLPAWQIMHRKEPGAVPLTFPSPTYDALRSGLVRTELILLRVLKFELRIPTPFDFLPGYISQVMRDFDIGDTSTDAAHGFDRRSKEKKEAAKITDIMDTGIAKACKTKALFACKSYQLANHFPAKTIAAGCVYIVLKNRGLLLEVHPGIWLKEKISRSIDMEDFEEAISILGQD